MRWLMIMLVLILSLSFTCFAEDDSLSFATYYPAPYGNYREMRTMRMAIGDNYIKTNEYDWEAGATNLIDSSADLIVEGNVGIGTSSPKVKLDVNGGVKFGSDLICNSDKKGTVRYYEDKLQCCNGATFEDVGGARAKYAIIADQKVAGVYGGASTSTWSTRDLNTEISDPDDIVSLVSNQFILQPGSYLIEASAPAAVVHEHRIRLQNISNGVTVAMGTSSYSNDLYRGETRSFVSVIVSISEAKVFEIQHRCDEAIGEYGFGRFSDYDNAPEIYTTVKITKL